MPTQKSLEEQLQRARELLDTVKHAAMATVNEDGSPHNTPFLFVRDAGLRRIFWGSHLESQHSKNVLRSRRLFVVLYEADKHGGLYTEAEKGHMLDGVELEEALAVHNQLRLKSGQDTLSVEYYTTGPQRMWAAAVRRLWVNGTQRGADGHIIRDIRTEITAQDLLN